MISTLQHETAPRPAAIQRRPGTGEHASNAALVALATLAVAIVPAAFWGGVVWLVWSWLPAAITAVVAMAGTLLTMGLLHAAGDIETSDHSRPKAHHADPAPSAAKLRHAA